MGSSGGQDPRPGSAQGRMQGFSGGGGGVGGGGRYFTVFGGTSGLWYKIGVPNDIINDKKAKGNSNILWLLRDDVSRHQ